MFCHADRPELRELLPLPRADRATGGGPGGGRSKMGNNIHAWTIPYFPGAVPTTGDPRLLRIALAVRVGLHDRGGAGQLLGGGATSLARGGMFGLIPLAIFMAYRRWNAYQRSIAGPDNVRIDDAGVHWIDAARAPASVSAR